MLTGVYRPAHFSVDDPAGLLAVLLSEHVATLVSALPGGMEVSLLPLLWAPERGEHGVLQGHLARANPHAAAGDGHPAVAVVTGVEGYVSPSWYASKAEHGRVVPTWDYVTAVATGTLRVRDDPAWLRDLLSRLTDRHEEGRAAPWAVTDAPEAFVNAQLRGIVGVELEVERIEAKTKLSQNRAPADVAGVVAGLAAGDARARALGEAVRAANPTARTSPADAG